jgi:DNA polymerase-3 subunit gamma/tau
VSEVLYNKYRPGDFSNVVGQDQVIKVLEAHLANGTLPHSLIFYGPFGTGKTTTARIVARTLNPSDHGLVEKDSTLEANMDHIRSLQQGVEHKPFQGEYKTYIFDEAHRINGKAFDALLKTIEEPPPHIKFIFVTSQFNSIPQSIRSRSECHGFCLLSNTAIKDKLEDVLKMEGKSLDPSLLDLVIDSSRGSLRDALVSLETVITQTDQGVPEDNIIKALGVVSNAEISAIVYAHIVEDFVALDTAMSIFSQPHVEPESAVSDLQQFLMDFRRAALYSVAFPEQNPHIRSDVHDLISTLPDPNSCGPKIDAMFDLTLELQRNLRYVHNKKSIFDRFVVNLGLSWSNVNAS